MILIRALFLFAIAIAVSAYPKPSGVKSSTPAAPKPTYRNYCNTGQLQCCSSVQPASNNDVKQHLKTFGISLPDSTECGISCSAIDSTSECDSTPACCDNNNFSGIIAIGCSSVPIFV